MPICTACGKTFKGKIYKDGTCQGCYNYFRNGGKIYSRPAPGYVAKTEDGEIICHICGRAFKKLGGHIKESHKMTIAEYKERFGLCNNTKLTAESYRECMRGYIREYNIIEGLMINGYNTRLKKGDTHLRQGKKSRQQECIEKAERMCRYVKQKKAREGQG